MSASQLCQYYERNLPGSFNPLHQIFTDENWIEDYIVQYISMPSYENLSIENFCENLTKGRRILSIAQAGMGKSTMMCQIAKRWMEQIQMSNANELTDMLRFKQVYLIPVRFIHNHRETLERIITYDLNLLGHDKEGDVRRQLKFNSGDVLFLIDGYDEMSEKERKYSTINKLLAGEVAPNAAVLATSRPHCLEYLTQCVIAEITTTHLLELDNQVLQKVLRSRFPNDNPEMLMKQFLEDVPGDIYRIPFFFTVLCYVWKRRKTSNVTVTSSEYQFTSVTDIMDAMWGLMLGIKEQKEEGCPHPEFYKSFRDGRLEMSTQRIIKQLAELCFATVKSQKTTFSDDQLQNYQIRLEELGKFGILRIDPEGQSHSFVHKLFMEHCAALHLVRSNVNISELLGHGGMLFNQNEYENVLLFAVGMEFEMLRVIMNITYVLHLIGGDALRIHEVDLSFHTRLLRECKDVTTKNVYYEYICGLPVREQFLRKQQIFTLPYRNTVFSGQHQVNLIYYQFRDLQGEVNVESPTFNADIYASFFKEMGLRRSLILLQSANPSEISYKEGKPTLTIPDDDMEVIVMTPLFLATLFATDVAAIPRLIIWWSHHKILELTKSWTVSHIHFITSCIYIVLGSVPKTHSVLLWLGTGFDC